MTDDYKKLFKRIIDIVFEKAEREGKSLTMEDVAIILDYTREHFSRLYHMKHPITKKHINKLRLTFPEVNATTIERSSKKQKLTRL